MQTITCPSCQTIINLDEALEAHLQTHLHQQVAQQVNSRLKEREDALKKELWSKALDEAQKRAASTQKEKDLQLQELQETLKAHAARAVAAEQNELELRKKQRELEEKSQQLELRVQRELDARIQAEKEKLMKAESERFHLKELEYQKQLHDMRTAVEEARRKGSVTSQQLQGEVLELELESLLRDTFPTDTISEVKKGQHGADMLHTVRNAQGKNVGIIVWESKQTEHFSDKWLPKLREDARAAKGSSAVLVSRVLPSDITVCAQRDHVWITGVEFVLPLAHLLRQTLLRVDQERVVQSGKEVKAEMLYSYINSQEFRGRVEAIVESFREMRDDLEKEQRALQNSWKKREKQILRLATNTAYMYGELQGVVGTSLPNIHGLTLESSLE